MMLLLVVVVLVVVVVRISLLPLPLPPKEVGGAPSLGDAEEGDSAIEELELNRPPPNLASRFSRSLSFRRLMVSGESSCGDRGVVGTSRLPFVLCPSSSGGLDAVPRVLPTDSGAAGLI